MTTLRTAAQQALEALEEYQSKGAPFMACDGAIDALRAALAQQDEPVQEPVAWYQKRGQEVLTSHPACWGREDEPWTPLYTATTQRKPETLDEAMRLPRAMAQAYENGYKAGAATLREESYLNYGTRLQSNIHGPCRVRHLYPDKLSAIIGNKPLGSLADVWFRLDADGRVWEWHRDLEVEVLRDE